LAFLRLRPRAGNRGARRLGSLKPLRALLVDHPIAFPLAFYATWLAGRLQLGYRPRPSEDDPGYIGTWGSVLSRLTIWLCLLGLPAFLVAHAALPAGGWRDKSQLSRARFVSACSMACMQASVSFLSWDFDE
jgi:hypothetical protein